MKVTQCENIQQACDVLLSAFVNCPANNYLNCKMQNVELHIPLASKQAAAQLTRSIIMHYYNNGAEVVEAGGYDTVAVWTTPINPVAVSKSNDLKFNKIFFDDLDNVKHDVIPSSMGYYYLFIIGRDPDSIQNSGSVRALFNHYITRAQQDQNAIVLEAISDHARDIYEHYGFKTYKTFKYGVGEVDPDGSLNLNGLGHVAYLMIRLPNEKFI